MQEGVRSPRSAKWQVLRTRRPTGLDCAALTGERPTVKRGADSSFRQRERHQQVHLVTAHYRGATPGAAERRTGRSAGCAKGARHAGDLVLGGSSVGRRRPVGHGYLADADGQPADWSDSGPPAAGAPACPGLDSDARPRVCARGGRRPCDRRLPAAPRAARLPNDHRLLPLSPTGVPDPRGIRSAANVGAGGGSTRASGISATSRAASWQGTTMRRSRVSPCSSFSIRASCTSTSRTADATARTSGSDRASRMQYAMRSNASSFGIRNRGNSNPQARRGAGRLITLIRAAGMPHPPGGRSPDPAASLPGTPAATLRHAVLPRWYGYLSIAVGLVFLTPTFVIAFPSFGIWTFLLSVLTFRNPSSTRAESTARA